MATIKIKAKPKAKAGGPKLAEPVAEKPTITLNGDNVSGIPGMSLDQSVSMVVKGKVLEVGRERWNNNRPYVRIEISAGTVDEKEPRNTMEAKKALL